MLKWHVQTRDIITTLVYMHILHGFRLKQTKMSSRKIKWYFNNFRIISVTNIRHLCDICRHTFKGCIETFANKKNTI